VVGLIAATVVLGWLFAWAQSKSYQTDRTSGFWMGLVHGAVMPAALPCLLAGKDVPIFAPNNTGRGYKLGYVFGINCSGIVFFGLSFRQNQNKAGARDTSRLAG
jgi:cytosine/uracil/thiamine/allantoin permease